MNKYEQIIINVAHELGLDKLNPLIPGFMVAQSAHESADWTSPVFLSCNNGFGYKYVGQKLAISACTNAPEGGAYAKYASFEDSVKDVAGWIMRRKDKFANVQTIDDYSLALQQNGYYGDTLAKYTAALRRHYAQIKDGLTTAIYAHPEISIATGITIFSMLGYYIYRVAKMKK